MSYKIHLWYKQLKLKNEVMFISVSSPNAQRGVIKNQQCHVFIFCDDAHIRTNVETLGFGFLHFKIHYFS
eukprot:UN08183